MSIPEYETYYSLGGTVMVDNIDAVIAADKLCDEYGLDTMSVGATIAFAMELTEKGIITKEDSDGIDLSFGNAGAMVEFIKKIAFRDGFGDILADGAKKAASKIGKGSEKYAMHVKGLELPAYDVRGAKAHGLNYATSYTGADHNRGYAFQEIFSIPVPYAVDRFAAEGKGKLTKWNQDTRFVCTDCAPMCGFLLDMAVPGICMENTADLVSAATGLEFTPEDVYKVGERCNNTAKLFNVKAGFTRADDDLPERLKTEPLKAGGAKGAVIPQAELDLMLDEYYEARGWTKDGVPTEEKLKELGLK
jgi:aldehyde:ferredoxin oxidoreductase